MMTMTTVTFVNLIKVDVELCSTLPRHSEKSEQERFDIAPQCSCDIDLPWAMEESNCFSRMLQASINYYSTTLLNNNYFMWQCTSDLGYNVNYGYDGAPLRSNEILELDHISVAAQARLHVLEHWAKRESIYFVQATCDLLNGRDIEKIITVPEERYRATSDKWRPHLDQLVSSEVLEEVTREEVNYCATYFAVPKTDFLARSIFNGRLLSRASMPPPPVNLPEITQVLERMSRLSHLGPLYMSVGDIRHWFHHIGVSQQLRRYFGLRLGNHYYRFRTLPMGWSWSPRCAQCLAWSFILYSEPGESTNGVDLETIRGIRNPPAFVDLKDPQGKIVGFITVFYDNIIIVSTSEKISSAWHQRIKSNSERLDITLKEWDWYSPSSMRPTRPNLPVYLGVEFSQEKVNKRYVLRWRHNAKKLDGWHNCLSTLIHPLTTPRTVARWVGSLVWDSVVTFAPLHRISDIINLLRVVPTAASTYGWDVPCITVSTQSKLRIKELLTTATAREWFYHTPIETTGDIILASDSSEKRWGWVLLTAEGMIADEHIGLWNSKYRNYDIYVKEACAACFTLRAALKRAPPRTRLIIAVDNTAAKHALRRGYSPNLVVNRQLTKVMQAIELQQCQLLVVGVRGVDNVADDPSRGKKARQTLATRTKHTIDMAMLGILTAAPETPDRLEPDGVTQLRHRHIITFNDDQPAPVEEDLFDDLMSTGEELYGAHESCNGESTTN